MISKTIIENGVSARKWATSNNVPDPDKLPQVHGWNILVRPIQPEEKTQGVIYIPTSAQEDLAYLSNVGVVKAVGPLAYKSPDKRFGPEETPWCKVGDVVVWARNEGQKFMYDGITFVLLADDRILMTIDDPERIDPTSNLRKR